MQDIKPNGINVLKARKKANISQEKLSEKTGLSVGTIGNIEAGKPCRKNNLQLIADELSVAYSALLLESAAYDEKFTRPDYIDYTGYIIDKTEGFVGRQFVFDAIDQFTSDNFSGYFFIRGDPGIGKSAIAAQLVKTRDYIHHFNIRPQGINKTDIFLKNICVQLTTKYELSHISLPREERQYSIFLEKLLSAVSDKRSSKEKIVIIIDALDEVDSGELSTGVNILCLPVILPEGVFVVATSRKEVIKLRIDCKQDSLFIEQDSAGNIADIKRYVENTVNRDGIISYMASQGLTAEQFIDHILEKSQGNFMYLHYVLPEIEEGVYQYTELDTLPLGLMNYYDDHWHRIKGQNEEQWFINKLPILMALTVVKEPVSARLISDFSGVKEFSRIHSVINDWSQFLYMEEEKPGETAEKRYRIYHQSFHDFIANKEEINDEKVSRKDAHKKITDDLWNELFSDQQIN